MVIRLLACVASYIKVVEVGIIMKRDYSRQAVLFIISLTAGTIFSGGDVTVGLIAAIIVVSAI